MECQNKGKDDTNCKQVTLGNKKEAKNSVGCAMFVLGIWSLLENDRKTYTDIEKSCCADNVWVEVSYLCILYRQWRKEKKIVLSLV